MALPTVSPLLSLGWVCLNSVFQASTSALKHWNHPSQSPIPPPCLTLACQSMSAASHDSQSTPLPDQREICGLDCNRSRLRLLSPAGRSSGSTAFAFPTTRYPDDPTSRSPLSRSLKSRRYWRIPPPESAAAPIDAPEALRLLPSPLLCRRMHQWQAAAGRSPAKPARTP